MKTVIVGAGAIGCAVGGQMVRAGKDVTFLARGETCRVLESEGLLLERDGKKERLYPLSVADSAGGENSGKIPEYSLLAKRLVKMFCFNAIHGTHILSRRCPALSTRVRKSLSNPRLSRIMTTVQASRSGVLR